jgi:LysR family transcriptional regulator, hypochlorite-specific transcription factor HypT
MELSWLEDFLALAESGSFSRAAERRNLTQPAFSRRIRALESWAGAALFDRDTRHIRLTLAGERFRPVAEETVRRLVQGREEAREVDSAVSATLRFACTHALSLTFFPDWLRSHERDTPLGSIRLISESLAACESLMHEGNAQFLLCHQHPAAMPRLEARAFVSLPQGDDVLIPVRAQSLDATLPGMEDGRLPYLAYSPESGLGRIVGAARAKKDPPVWLEPVFTAHLATAIRAMAVAGRGIAWLPLTLIQSDLATGRLVRAGSGDWDIPVEIRVYRPRHRLSPTAEQFWDCLS